MCYKQDPVIYLFVVLANVFYVLVQTVWISLRGILWASTAHQTSLYNKPHRTTKTAEYQYLNEAGIPQDWYQHMNCVIIEYVPKLNIFDVWSSLTSMSMHKLRNIAILVAQLLGFHQFLLKNWTIQNMWCAGSKFRTQMYGSKWMD